MGLDRLDRSTGNFLHIQQTPSGSDDLDGLIARDVMTDRSTVYKHNPDDPHTLPDNTIHSVYEDRDGVQRIGTDQGLGRFDTTYGAFVHDLRDPSILSILRDVTVYAINEDSQGALWFGTQVGLNQWDRDEDQLIEHRHDPDAPESISSDTIRSIFRDSLGLPLISVICIEPGQADASKNKTKFQ